jgi:hypothetical protein
MEDKEREFYFQWITQCMQFNMQMMNNMMQMALAMTAFAPSSPMPQPRMPPMPPNMSAFLPSQEDINKIMKSMGFGGLGKPAEDKDLT